MTPSKTPLNQAALNQFATKEWDKAIAYLQKHFSLPQEDCEDIFQEAFIVLYNNARSGKLDELSSSLSTYFISICRNKALERLRGQGVAVGLEHADDLAALPDVQEQQISNLLALDPDVPLIEAKEAIARQIVRALPSPCNELLWGFFRDGYKLKTLAEMLNKTEGYVKVTKHRCQEKFRKRWQQLTAHLF